ncbi:DUF1801 domain-containing protein [Micrococcales bacterium 31B]|nr:DUF1801 domain-containing protein [Micrococcales bacterium 31B]
MPDHANKTQPGPASVQDFLDSVPPVRAADARTLIPLYEQIAGEPAVMWGPSIIGFGSVTYTLASGQTERMPLLGFSPRKANLTLYFSEGFDHYGDELARLGPHKASRSCLYVTRLERIDLDVLTSMLRTSVAIAREPARKPTSVEEYVAQIPDAARPHFDRLRALVAARVPGGVEKFSYGIVGFVPEGRKRPYVFVSGWKDHVAIYPVPKAPELQAELKGLQRGKGTLWFALDEPLPEALIERVADALVAG